MQSKPGGGGKPERVRESGWARSYSPRDPPSRGQLNSGTCPSAVIQSLAHTGMARGHLQMCRVRYSRFRKVAAAVRDTVQGEALTSTGKPAQLGYTSGRAYDTGSHCSRSWEHLLRSGGAPSSHSSQSHNHSPGRANLFCKWTYLRFCWPRGKTSKLLCFCTLLKETIETGKCRA